MGLHPARTLAQKVRVVVVGLDDIGLAVEVGEVVIDAFGLVIAGEPNAFLLIFTNYEAVSKAGSMTEGGTPSVERE